MFPYTRSQVLLLGTLIAAAIICGAASAVPAERPTWSISLDFENGKLPGGWTVEGDSSNISFEKIPGTNRTTLVFSGPVKIISPFYPYEWERIHDTTTMRYEDVQFDPNDSYQTAVFFCHEPYGPVGKTETSDAVMGLVDWDDRAVTRIMNGTRGWETRKNWPLGRASFRFAPHVTKFRLSLGYDRRIQKGRIYLDSVRLNFYKDLPRPVNKDSVNVTVDATKKLGVFRPTYTGGHLVYGNDIDLAIPCLARMRQAGFEWMRLGEFSSSCRTYEDDDEKGNPVYNWAKLDHILDALVKDNGFKLVFTIWDTPEALIDKNNTTWCRTRSQPANMSKWKNYVRDVVLHCQERYGKKTVESWYWELWNEPGGYPSYYGGHLEDFMVLYDYTVAGIQEANPDLKIGGAGGSWPEEFMKHCAVGTNAVTGKTGTHADFVALHAYPLGGGIAQYVYDEQARVMEIKKDYPQLRRLEFVNTESSTIASRDFFISWGGPHASRIVRSTKIQMKLGMYPNIFHCMNGIPALFTPQAVPTSIFNGFKMLNMLRGMQVIFEALEYWLAS